MSCADFVESTIEVELPVNEIVLAQWNIGHFSFGNKPVSGITSDKFYIQYRLYRQMLRAINADVLALCEYSLCFGCNDNGVQNSEDLFFKEYDYRFEGHQSSYACNALFSKEVLNNVCSHSFTCSNTNYYYISADLLYEQNRIKLISTHLAFNNADDQLPIAQMKELIDICKDDEYVIMMGDWNINDVKSFEPFLEAGYTLANHGKFGDIETFSRKKDARNYVLDNIIVKNLYITDVKVIQKDLSDHYPLIVKVTFDNPSKIRKN